jgi:hypothetical protein
MRSCEEFDETRHNKYHIRGYDYRYVRSAFLTMGGLYVNLQTDVGCTQNPGCWHTRRIVA